MSASNTTLRSTSGNPKKQFYFSSKIKTIFYNKIRSFGCVLYEILTLKQLFKGKNSFGTFELIKNFKDDNLKVCGIEPIFATLLKK